MPEITSISGLLRCSLPEHAPAGATSTFAAWLGSADYLDRYRARCFPSCEACPAREQAAEALMDRHGELRRDAAPIIVRLLLIAESPPWSAPGAAVRHFYNPESPPPDNLFRAAAAALLGEDRSRWQRADKSAALARLAQGGFLLLDSAKCPVNHLPSAEKRAALRACADHVLREELLRVPFASDATICMVVRTTVPPAAGPVLRSLGLEQYLVEPEGLPFPGRWPQQRARFIEGLRRIVARRDRP